ncbi:MAG: translation initiation factor IF-2 [Candidatus Peribacteraceae bacterium]|nr:translation initiation factor IF-2 [Candidatus Peribacteraceae bacterium]
MRLVRVAKALGMTGQQLRHELEQVNFGVKPTDREVPDNLAQGIIRFIARKHNIPVDFATLGLEAGQDDEEEENGGAPVPREQEASVENAQQSDPPATAAVPSKEGLNVLRKLSLEDVPKQAIRDQQEALGKPRLTREEEEERLREERAQAIALKKKQSAQGHQEQIKSKEGAVVSLPAHVSVKEFAEKTGIQVPKVMQTLMKNGVMATINQTIDYDTAAIVAAELHVEVAKEQGIASAEDLLSRNLKELLRDEPENLVKRPPIVVVMGHVDHGKTSILDAVRSTDVVTGEAGGITQQIGAYQVEHVPAGSKEVHKITFLDTPGHEAFTAMRARGAQATDIAIIVVAADEGVKPTTVEAINHAKEAGVPILVALNKIDKEHADPDRVKGELSAQGLQPEEWGGKTPIIPVSAKTKQGITDLLDAIVLTAEIAEFKANPFRSAVATVIESHLDKSLGALATVVVNTGTLRAGDVFVCGKMMGKVRAMTDAHGQRFSEVPPSGAVRVSGFDHVPRVGDILQVMSSEQQARSLAQAVRQKGEQQAKRRFVDLVSRLSEGKVKQLKIVLKADTQGALEAIKDALDRLSGEQVGVKVIHAAIGAVTETDVMMAAASDGIVLAFNAPMEASVLRTAEREGVEVKHYDVVYQLLDDVEALVKGLVKPEEEENILGHLEIKAVFLTKKSEQIVGGRVLDGTIKRLPFRLQRGGQEAGTGRITSLKHAEKDIKEAKEGSECGLRVETSTLIVEGDILEVYVKELKRKES